MKYMKHYSFFVLIAASSMTLAEAAQRNLSDARAIAESTLSVKAHKAVMLDVAELGFSDYHAAPSFANGANSGLRVPYYLFTSANNDAFAFVSGSDLMPEVLGYGVDASLPADRSLWPSNLISWLDYVAEVENAIEQHPELADNLQHAKATSVTVSPLLTTKWGQDWPYNLQCPSVGGQLSVTGCMATSVSQVLNYHEWPTQFSGSYTYYSNGTSSSYNFEGHTFDYSQMLDSYNRNNSTEEQQQEVAELMHCVGHALSMGYSPSGSGAYAFMGSKAFVNFIGATKSATLYRNLFSLDEWNQIIQSELQAFRPLIFNGQASSGGHSFVLDGVNSDGLYHVNWGWNGQADGYFDVSILNPEDRGTGASASSDGFSGDQSIVVGLCNPEDNPKFYTELRSSSSSISIDKSSVTLGSVVNFSMKARNQSELPFDGKVGVVVYDMEGNEVDRYLSNTAVHIDATSYVTTSYYFEYQSYGEKTVQCPYTFPTSMPDGTYRVYMIVQPDGSEEWDYLRSVHTRYSYRTFEVANNKATFATSTSFSPHISATSWEYNNGNEVFSGIVNIKVNLKNDGDEAVAGVYLLKLTNGGSTLPEIESPIITIPAHSEGVVTFTPLLTRSGSWKATLRVKDVCVSDTKHAVGENQFSASYHPTYSASLSVVKDLSTPDSVYSHGVGTFQLSVMNEGDIYDGTMSVRIFTSRTSTADKNKVAEITTPITVAAGSTSVLSFTGELDIAFTTGKKTLYGRVYYLLGDEMVLLSSKVMNVNIYGNQSSGIDQVEDAEEADTVVFDVYGRRVEHPSNGIYLVGGRKIFVR